MFENIVNQPATRFISADLKRHTLPRSILFSGDEGDGKLSAALETSRVLSCRSEEKIFNCECNSCLQQKALVASNILLLGPRDCFLEIAAAKETFMTATKENQSYKTAARYFFIRSVRKLTLRFNGILWQGDSNLNKIGSLMETINEDLELLDFPNSLPDIEKLEEVCQRLVENTKKLESEYLYDSIPISQIRNMEEWAHIKADEGKKTIIIENAEQMQSSVRNALLKILEEPPADCQFILLTNKKNAIMETILSRVRNYSFKKRTLDEQKKVLNLVFHKEYDGFINDYLMEFLPVQPVILSQLAKDFFDSIKNRKIPDISQIVKKSASFVPRIQLKIFLLSLLELLKPLRNSPQGSEVLTECVKLIKECRDNITLYNQTPVSALEILLRNLSALNIKNGCIFNICKNT